MSLTTQDLQDIRNVVVDAINESFEVLSTPRFDALEERMDRLETRMDRLETKTQALETAQSQTNRRLEAIETKLEVIEADIETLKNDVEALYELASKPMLPALDEEFEKLSKQDKLYVLRSYIYKLAEQSNIQL